MVMVAGCIVSELLCYLQNYFGKTPWSILCSTVVGFYDESEIVEVKNCLFTWVSNADLDFTDIPRNKPRKAGDNKRKFDTEDIMALFEYFGLQERGVARFRC